MFRSVWSVPFRAYCVGAWVVLLRGVAWGVRGDACGAWTYWGCGGTELAESDKGWLASHGDGGKRRLTVWADVGDAVFCPSEDWVP